MKQLAIILSSLLLLTLQCTRPEVSDQPETKGNTQSPRVLFITSGISDGNMQLPQGIVVAIQSFNRLGAVVRLEPRDILFNYEELSQFNVLILSTFPGYHDADRQYSLSYMTDVELHNLAKFVEQGGYLISGDNVGRNYSDGTDRISVFQQLNDKNWELANCFGVSLSEKNMTGLDLEGSIPGQFDYSISRKLLTGEDRELWILTPDAMLGNQVKILGKWALGGDSAIAVTENSFGTGKSFLLASSGLLHPKNDGGFWSADQIDQFYRYVIGQYNLEHNIKFRLNPWPDGYDYAFCVSLNAEGDADQYRRTFDMLKREKIEPVIFVKGAVPDEVASLLKNEKHLIASGGFGYINHSDLKYPQALEDILLNENYWDTDFKGFRFPFTTPGYWSLMALSQRGYDYESSIGADNLDFFHGSVVPHNLVIAQDEFCVSTDILEIAPTYHDDYYFLDLLKEGQEPDSNKLQEFVGIYAKYLSNYWNYAVKPYGGLMVYLGHPEFSGYNEATLAPLRNLVSEVKKDNTWITTMNEVADFRKGLESLQFFISDKNGLNQVDIVAPEGVMVRNVCLNMDGKIRDASAGKGKTDIIETEAGSRMVFDAFSGQSVTWKAR